MIRGPTIVNVRPTARHAGGVNCCCCRCCTCLNLQVLKTEPGVTKLGEVILGFLCQTLVFNFGTQYSSAIGSSYQSYTTSISWCFMTTLLLLACYVFSQKSLSLIKSSLFETLFNGLAAFSLITSCSYLGWAVNTVLQPMYVVTPFFQVFPAMSAAYMMGTILGFLYAYDAYKSYRYYRGFP